MKSIPLGDVMVSRGGSINPAAHPDELFELYSIPAHDRGGPELLPGREIGSAKQCVEPGDVMVSKIIPHIRRARVVTDSVSARQIASGEWIVFRGGGLHPDYLRHYLLSDGFHAQFMATVAGVGGSLVRARPEHVKAIQIPVPDLPEQRRIAAILDQADALRANRYRVLTQFDELVQAAWSTASSRASRIVSLAELIIEGPSNGLYRPASDYGSGTRILRIDGFGQDGMHEGEWKRVRLTEIERVRFALSVGDIIINRVNALSHLGKCVLIEHLAEDSVFESNMMRLRVDESLACPQFVIHALRSSPVRQQILRRAKKAINQASINQADVRGLAIPLPSIRAQHEFEARVEAIAAFRTRVGAAMRCDQELFDALQSRAFRGEL